MLPLEGTESAVKMSLGIPNLGWDNLKGQRMSELTQDEHRSHVCLQGTQHERCDICPFPGCIRTLSPFTPGETRYLDVSTMGRQQSHRRKGRIHTDICASANMCLIMAIRES